MLIKSNINNISKLLFKELQFISINISITILFNNYNMDTIGHEIYLSEYIFIGIFKLAGLNIENIENIH